MSAVSYAAVPCWDAQLDLGFRHDRRTTLEHRSHRGPLRVQKPFYPGDGACHVYVLHPPGGVAGGDSIDIGVSVAAGASALATTPAATKVYRSLSAGSSISQRIRVAASATFEWLPEDTILFGGSRATQRSVVHLDPTSRYFGWETVSLGRPRSGDLYASGCFSQAVDIHVGNVPLLIERLDWRDADPMLSAPWGLGGRSVIATAWIYPGDASTLERARRLIRWTRIETMAATLLDGLLVIRALGRDAVRVQNAMRYLWAGLRKETIGLEPSPPRIWAT